MTGRADPEPVNGHRKSIKTFPPLTTILDALLSTTFLVLAVYIGLYASGMEGKDGRDMFWFSLLLGAYGIWRAIRSVIRHRQNRQDEAE